jgi:hypothetical protein
MKIFATLSILAVATALTVSILTAGPAGGAGFSAPEFKAFDRPAPFMSRPCARTAIRASRRARVVHDERRPRAAFDPGTQGSWKDKRIRRDSPVIVWIGGAQRSSFVGRAEITKDAAVVDKILTNYPKKYTMNALVGPSRENFESGDRIALGSRRVKDMPALLVGAGDPRARTLAILKGGRNGELELV